MAEIKLFIYFCFRYINFAKNRHNAVRVDIHAPTSCVHAMHFQRRSMFDNTTTDPNNPVCRRMRERVIGAIVSRASPPYSVDAGASGRQGRRPLISRCVYAGFRLARRPPIAPHPIGPAAGRAEDAGVRDFRRREHGPLQRPRSPVDAPGLLGMSALAILVPSLIV